MTENNNNFFDELINNQDENSQSSDAVDDNVSFDNASEDDCSFLEKFCVNDIKTKKNKHKTQGNHSSIDHKLFNKLIVILVANTLVLGFLLAFAIFHKSDTVLKIEETSPKEIKPQDTEATKIDEKILEQYSEGISYKLAQKLFNEQNYNESLQVNLKLKSQIVERTINDEILKDYLSLNIALCHEKLGQTKELNKTLTKALNSKSVVIQLLANYNLSFIELNNRNFLEARKRAYKTIALLNCCRNRFPAELEQDMYFLICDALTTHAIELTGSHDLLPGKSWARNFHHELPAPMAQSDLISFLMLGKKRLNTALFGPEIIKKIDSNKNVLINFNANNAPISESLALISSESDLEINWGECDDELKNLSVTAIIENENSHRVCEELCGCCGLLPIISNNKIGIYNPLKYTSLKSHKNTIINQAISAWRRYLFRYQDPKRKANAHYAIARLYEMADNYPSAISEYKIAINIINSNEIKPYAIFQASQIKAKIGDYIGANQDLNDLITLFPDCKIIDVATLNLAKNSLNAKNYKQAAVLFNKVYSFDTNRITKCQAAIGAGKSFFMLESYKDAAKCFVKATKIHKEDHHIDICETYELLGDSLLKLKKPESAAHFYKLALERPDINSERSALIANKKAHAELDQNLELIALSTLNNIDLESLSQKTTTETLLMMSKTYRKIGLFDTATTMLRHKIENIAEKDLRGRLTLELGKCYSENNELELGKKELLSALNLLPAGGDFDEANFELAKVLLKQKDYGETINTCQRLLNCTDTKISHDEITLLMAKAYNQTGMHNKAVEILTENNLIRNK